MPASQGTPKPLEEVAGVLQRSGAACHDLASSAEWLQDQLSSLVDAGKIQPCRETMMAMQELDRISQVLRGLGDLNCELAVYTPDAWAPSDRLASAARLDSLAARIVYAQMPGNVEDEFW